MKTGRQLTDSGCSEDSRPVLFLNERFTKAAPCKYPTVQKLKKFPARLAAFGEKVRKGVKKFAALCLERLHCSRRWLQKRERYTPLSARVPGEQLTR